MESVLLQERGTCAEYIFKLYISLPLLCFSFPLGHVVIIHLVGRYAHTLCLNLSLIPHATLGLLCPYHLPKIYFPVSFYQSFLLLFICALDYASKQGAVFGLHV